MVGFVKGNISIEQLSGYCMVPPTLQINCRYLFYSKFQIFIAKKTPKQHSKFNCVFSLTWNCPSIIKRLSFGRIGTYSQRHFAICVMNFNYILFWKEPQQITFMSFWLALKENALKCLGSRSKHKKQILQTVAMTPSKCCRVRRTFMNVMQTEF